VVRGYRLRLGARRARWGCAGRIDRTGGIPPMNLRDPEYRRVLRIRLLLWLHFWPPAPGRWRRPAYRVVVRWHRKSAPWPNYWSYVSLVDGLPACEIGPIDQWSMAQAIAHAREQWLGAGAARIQPIPRPAICVSLPGVGYERLPAAATPDPHRMLRQLLPSSNYRLICACGWASPATREGHMCLPENCAECAALEGAWQDHRKGVSDVPV
jgi:hypothetical protein